MPQIGSGEVECIQVLPLPLGGRGSQSPKLSENGVSSKDTLGRTNFLMLLSLSGRSKVNKNLFRPQAMCQLLPDPRVNSPWQWGRSELQALNELSEVGHGCRIVLLFLLSSKNMVTLKSPFPQKQLLLTKHFLSKFKQPEPICTCFPTLTLTIYSKKGEEDQRVEKLFETRVLYSSNEKKLIYLQQKTLPSLLQE